MGRRRRRRRRRKAEKCSTGQGRTGRGRERGAAPVARGSGPEGLANAPPPPHRCPQPFEKAVRGGCRLGHRRPRWRVTRRCSAARRGATSPGPRGGGAGGGGPRRAGEAGGPQAPSHASGTRQTRGRTLCVSTRFSIARTLCDTLRPFGAVLPQDLVLGRRCSGGFAPALRQPRDAAPGRSRARERRRLQRRARWGGFPQGKSGRRCTRALCQS